MRTAALRRTRVAAAGLVGLAALASVAACSNREAPVNKRPHTGTATAVVVDGVQQVTLTTGVDLRFRPSTFVVHRGLVQLKLINQAYNGGGPPHNLEFSGLPGDDVPITYAGETQVVTFTAPAPGTYAFVCTIHAAQGQTGTMIVR
jgi:plastocyanin